jgi:hypothetical protein
LINKLHHQCNADKQCPKTELDEDQSVRMMMMMMMLVMSMSRNRELDSRAWCSPMDAMWTSNVKKTELDQDQSIELMMTMAMSMSKNRARLRSMDDDGGGDSNGDDDGDDDDGAMLQTSNVEKQSLIKIE